MPLHPTSAPTLYTPRLILRAHELRDFGASLSLWTDPDVTRHISGRAFSAEEVWARLLRYAGHWALLGFGYWAAEDRASGQMIGEVGLAEFRRDLTPSILGTPEIGWVLAPAFHGRGLATEAVQAVLGWHDAATSGPERTVCLISPGNAASIRVAEKTGYTPWVHATYHGEDTLIMERPGRRP